MKETYRANFASPGFDGKAPASILFFPAGKSNISASKGGKPVQLEVNVDKEVADLLQSELAAAIAAAETGTASRPFVDFAHEGKTAAALPTAFRWEEGKGVMLDLEWTASGKAAVEGKDFSYFSPEWFQKDGKVTGLNLPGTIGGLVNTPAFQNIGKIAAALTQNPTMDELLKLFKDLGIVAEDVTEITPEIVAVVRDKLTPKPEVEVEMEAMRAARVQADSDLVTAQASIVSLTKQIEANAETHAAALKAVESSVNVKVAEIVKAAGVKTPIAGSTISKPEQKIVNRAAFDAMSQRDRDDFFKAGGKITS
jgi:phage I-like protein